MWAGAGFIRERREDADLEAAWNGRLIGRIDQSFGEQSLQNFDFACFGHPDAMGNAGERIGYAIQCRATQRRVGNLRDTLSDQRHGRIHQWGSSRKLLCGLISGTEDRLIRAKTGCRCKLLLAQSGHRPAVNPRGRS